RAGHSKPASVVHQVHQEVQRRLRWVSDPTEEAHLRTILEFLQHDRAGALAYAESVIAWEAIPYDERQQRKEERGRHFQRQYMAAHPVTDAQLRHLRFLGYTGVLPANRLAASMLIDEVRNARWEGRL